MRASRSLVLLGLGLCGFGLAVLGACSVPDKRPATGDDAGPGSDAAPAAPPDTAAPETMLDDTPGPFSNQRQPTLQFSSTDARATFECRIDAQPAKPCTSPYVPTLADGPHSFSVRALDPSGNSDDTPAELVWTVDTVAPDTMLVDHPPSADNSVMAKFVFRSTEPNAQFDCSLDNAAYQACASGGSFGPVTDGTHTFAVRARDRAGNLDASPSVFAWTVNTSTPDTQIITEPPDASATTSASFSFVSPDAGAGSSFTCALDGAAFTACTSPKAYTALAEGSHTFAVQVRDAAGNVDPSPATRTWVVDLTPPTTTISAGPTGAQPVASASVSFAADETDVTFTCSLDGGAFAACTSPASLTALAQGPHTFAVRATDAAGHPDASPATASWTVDTVPPDVAITAGPNAAGTSGPRVAFAFTASEGTATCSFDGGAFAACNSPAATNLAAGPHTFAVHATDAAGNTGMMTRSWTVACSAPDATGAGGLLHLDDTGQTLANAVTDGAPATLGDTPAVEADDPAALAGGRFGGALGFTASAGDHAVWPIALGASAAFTIELWAQPTASTGARDVVVSDDGRIALRATLAGASTVRFSAAVVEGGTGGMTRTAVSAPVAAGAWHHVLASLGGSTLRLWVDGVRTEIAGVTPATPPALDGLTLGGAGATAYDGALDEVWIAQTAISTDEPALERYCPL